MTPLTATSAVPIFTTGLLAALIIGTSYGSNSEIRQNKADARTKQAQAEYEAEQAARAAGTNKSATEEAAELAAAAEAGTAAATDATATALKAAATCAAASCTVTFPKAGGTVTVFGKPMVMKKAFASGLSYTYAGKPGSASTAKPGVAGAYKVTVTKADAAGFTMTVAK